MKIRIFIFICLMMICKFSFGQITFQKLYGGSDVDLGYSVAQTNDSGYIIGALTGSFGAGDYDIYLIKTNKFGDTLFTKTYGTSGSEQLVSVQQTFDGGFIIGGSTTSFGIGGYLIKTDANGDTSWTRILDRSFVSIQQISDSGFILTGSVTNFGAGNDDFYLTRLDKNANVVWIKSYGGAENDDASSVRQTSDGGFIIIGTTLSFGISQPNAYLVKTDLNGNLLWSKMYGDLNEADGGTDIQQTYDGGYIITGYTGGIIAPYHYGYIVRTDSAGNALWGKAYGGAYSEEVHSIQLTNDSECIVAGFNNNVPILLGSVFLIKFNLNGDTLFSKTFNLTGDDIGNSAQQTFDNGFIVTGISTTGQVGSANVYLIKTDANGNNSCPSRQIIVNLGTASSITTNSNTIVNTGTTISSPASTIIGNTNTVTTLCSPVIVNEIENQNDILVYPNPFTNNFSIIDTKETALAIIYDITGKEILHQITSEGKTIINTANLPDGFYLLNYIDKEENRSENFKLMKF